MGQVYAQGGQFIIELVRGIQNIDVFVKKVIRAAKDCWRETASWKSLDNFSEEKVEVTYCLVDP